MLKIVFSYPTDLPNEIALVNQLLDSDIDYFHIRKPDYEESELEAYLKQLNQAYCYKIILHSHYRLTNKFQLGGIHLNQKGLSELRTEEESDKCYIEPLLLKNGEILVNGQSPDMVSYAAHGFDDIHNLHYKADYITLSPIFDSISKADYRSKFTDHDLLKKALSKTNHKIIALGGVKASNVNLIKDLGFSGYALLGDYWIK